METATILHTNPNFRIGDFMGTQILLERPKDRELVRERMAKAGLPE